jgi:DNA-binding response OmpR family regulator
MSKTVLLIEDEPHIVAALRFLLQREGLTVFDHGDGQDATQRIKSVDPDLVILDVMLPGKSGMQILEELRDDGQTRDLPVLMLTAKGQKKDREAAESAGASMFMTKPFANEEILRNVKVLLNR